MVKFTNQDLSGSRFDQCDLSRSRFHNSYFRDVKLSGVWLERVDISGLLRDVTVNGIDIGPLVEAELDRRHPERAKLRPTDPAGYGEAWDVIEGSWPATVDRARRLDPALLHERVDGEWSFIETLRHLVFATDAWVKAAILGDPAPFDPLGLPHDEIEDDADVPNDRDARPTLDDVLALRADRMAVVRSVIDSLTDDALACRTEPNPHVGYPPPDAYDVRRCLSAILNEEWEHHLFANRDLAVLEAR